VTEQELEDLVARFLDRTLPHSEWTHRAHLCVGMWHVHRFGEDEALFRLRDCIRLLNEVHGTPNSETRGYHETITRAYVTILSSYLASGNGESLGESVSSFLASPAAGKDYLLHFYSKERLMSVEARAAWMEPDLGDLETCETL
jgi:hypothetical protein